MTNQQRDALVKEWREIGKGYVARASGHLPNSAGMLEKDKFNAIAAAYFYCAQQLEETKHQGQGEGT